MTSTFSIDLYQIASIAEQNSAVDRNFTQRVSPQMLGENIHKLAQRVRGVAALDNDQVLLTFFSAEAIAILFTMPNRYWFWRVVAYSALAADDAAEVISAAIVKDALRHFRSGLGSDFDFTRRIDQLTVQEACLSVAAGIILLKSDDGLMSKNFVPVFNPIFQPHG